VELVRDAEGRTRGLLGVLADITGRKGLEQDTFRAREAAEAAQRVKREFLANMSHEVRTPLNGVIGLAAALSYGKLAPDQAEMVRMIRRSGEELEHMLTGVLDLVQLDAGRSEAAREAFDPLAVLTDAGARWAAAARRKGLRLEVARPQEIATGLGDPARVGRILDQLLDNAVKFTAEGSIRLSLEQRVEHGRVRTVFTVRDSGMGFDEDKAERLFERFEQAEGGATRSFGGSGLGLALCRALAGSLGGRIEARSRPGLGATFQLDFHLEPAPGSEALVSAA
jgi:signal transduction histidine kinase